jgi:hypothetical protein
MASTSVLGQADQAPVLFPIPEQTVAAATQLGPLSFTVWDPQNSPVSVEANSSDTNLVRDADIQLKLASLGDSGTNIWSLILVPSGVNAGKAFPQLWLVAGLDGYGTTPLHLRDEKTSGPRRFSTHRIRSP